MNILDDVAVNKLSGHFH